jgi:PTS system nitrogen regulatory IIA component
MNLVDILEPNATRVVAQVASKKRLLQDLADLADELTGLTPGAAFDALLDREALGPTGVGRGVALPHARISGLKHVTGVFIRLEKPIDYEAVDRQPIDLVFALFAPEEAGVEHLKALALVSRTLRDPAICAKLRSNSNPVTVHAILTDTTATRAA